MCPINFPVKLCSPWDIPVHFLGGWAWLSAGVCSPAHGSSPAGGGQRFTSSDGTSCLLIPAGAWLLRRECKEQGQCHMILPMNTQAGFTFPAPGNKEVQDFLICSYSELIAANGVMLHK